MTDTASASPVPGTAPRATKKGIILLVLGISQLMIILDASIVNVALQTIRVALNVDEGNLTWVVTAYTLAFGGLLLLGGKLADRLGRRRVFMTGAALFALASFIGGFANSFEVLVVARAIQGAGGALMAPAALSLLTVVFDEGKERDRAFGVWAAISAGGAAIGLILGGLLVEYVTWPEATDAWRWVLFVNVPIAAFALWGAMRYVPESRDERRLGFDIPGTLLVTVGLMTLVYGLVNGNEAGWGSSETLLILGVAILLLVAFVVVQATSSTPLVPRSVFHSRSVIGANAGSFLIASGLFSIFFFIVLWMQSVNGWTPLKSGFAFLPFTVGIVIGAGIASTLIAKIGPRPLVTIGPLIAAAGMLALGLRLTPDADYASVLLPSFMAVSIGLGLSFPALFGAAVAGVKPENTGIASALVNATQQVGGSVGLAALTAVFLGHRDSLAPAGGWGLSEQGFPLDPTNIPAFVDATVEGWNTGLVVGSGLLVLAAIVMLLLVRRSTTIGAQGGAHFG